MSKITGIHHVQLTGPAGCEPDARAFYIGMLGLQEIPKPKELRDRGGVWFHTGGADIHIGAKPGDTPPGAYRHIALQVKNLNDLKARLELAGVKMEDAPHVEGWNRVFIYDPFGNKLELLEIL